MIDVKNIKRDMTSSSSGFGKKTAVFLIVAAVLFVLWYTARIAFEYIKVGEVGQQYTPVFVKTYVTRMTIWAISFVLIFVSTALSVLFLRRNLMLLSIDRGIFESLKISLLISFVATLFLDGLVSHGIGEEFLKACNSQNFNMQDPVFGKDIGYFVFVRPFFVSLCDSLLSIWVLITAAVFVSYWLFGATHSNYSGKEFLTLKAVAVHNFVNIGILLIIICFNYMLKAENILYSSFGELDGAGFTDKTVWLSYYRIAPFLLVFIVIIAGVFILKQKSRLAIKTILIYPLSWVLAAVVAFGTQTIVVAPNEVIRESENIASNIKYTQKAYGLDDISEVEFDVKNDLSVADLNANQGAVDNIRILDLSANLTVLNQIQGIRNYYQFSETDIVPYEIDGKETAVAITPREITKENLSDSADTYINRTLRYTHGFGLTMNVISEVTSQGQPLFLVKDIPPKSESGVEKITQPRIYYGELTNDYVVVGNEKYKELDYSEGQEDIEFSYDGSGGLKLNFFNRALFAAKYGDIRLLISDLVSSDSRILINRNIVERLKTVAPFFRYDADPYMVIDNDGTLKWVVDAYTTTEYFPYSQSYGEFNYIRNSVKAVVDAYNGSVTFYISDKSDPIALAYSKIYPSLFSSEEIPEGIKEHIKYPEYIFNVQANVYGKYHISNPTTFYNKNDMWVIAKERYGTATEEKEIAPYYNMMKLQGKESSELLLTIPYTLTNKDNMVAWLAAQNDWESYGKLKVYKFPKDINVYGPMQIENRINSDMDISKELNLWSQGGSKVIRGNMIVVPIGNSVLYVEPIYIASSNQSTLPELKQVVVAYGEKIVMKNNLSDALYALFNEKAPPKETLEESVPGDVETEENQGDSLDFKYVAQKVIEEFNRAKQANKDGDWSGFGESMQALEKSIGELSESIK
ncbi:MAG: UPF0182 family protein [Clostridia bacterium]|nr:UPF0182 family protein [Clostridia bacterium]